MGLSEQELDREPLISGAETSGANGSLKSSLQKCIPCNCCWPWFTNTDQSEMESTRPEPIEASGNKYNHQVSERGVSIRFSLRRMMTAASSSSHHQSQPLPESVEQGMQLIQSFGTQIVPHAEWNRSSSHHQSQPLPESVEQMMSDGLYKFYEPPLAHDATLDIFFFHGLECEGSNLRDAYKSSWTSTEQTDTDGRMDLHQIVENLMHEIKWARKEHDFHRPVILVGHGFGGIVVKNLCTYAHNKKEKSVGGSDMSMFLDSIRAFFFYAMPHLGAEGIEAPAEREGPLLKWMRVLNSDSLRLHEAFSELWRAIHA
ncbi:hypothetical protein R1flu_003711 [Riccia fluitans]|uniref:DUF676 domain-containing protein n=1 Tax=Riccia fluitans TaxID=41844 RepID=A0ABD1YA36_9MARC